jgi:hypothetical protein
MNSLHKFDIRQAFGMILIVFVAGFMANTLVYVFLVRPVVVEFETLDNSSLSERSDSNENKLKIEFQEKYLADIVHAQNDLVTLRKDILSTRRARMIEVEVELHKLAGNHSVNMERVQYQNSELLTEELDRLGMVVPFEGSYKSLRDLIEAIEHSDKFFVIEKVALGEGNFGAASLLMNITIATYFDAPYLRELAAERSPQRRPPVRGEQG